MIKAYKKIGQTPLELLDELRNRDSALRDETLSYAGRLDPMAEGEMLILVGSEENRSREKHLGYDKEYEAEILFGVSTDSHDLLGLIQGNKPEILEIIDYFAGDNMKYISEAIERIRLIKTQKYPEFSSKTVQGKPLFAWKKENRLNEIDIPEREIEIKSLQIIGDEMVSAGNLYKYIQETIGLVNGDFRQREILQSWKNLFEKQIAGPNFDHLYFPVLKIRITVSSGTYIRGLAHELGRILGVPTCLFKLKRTKIINVI